MFQKFVLAFKTKTYDLFAEEEDNRITTTTTSSSPPAVTAAANVFTLLDSSKEFIPNQKVVVIKLDPAHVPKIIKTQFTQTLISSIFSTVSSLEASYLNFQMAHVPKIDQDALESADKLVSNLQKLTDLKNVCRNLRKNQSKLKTLETMVNQLIPDIERKNDQVSLLRKKLDQDLIFNSNLSKKLEKTNENLNKGMEVMLTIRVFESILRDSVRNGCKFYFLVGCKFCFLVGCKP